MAARAPASRSLGAYSKAVVLGAVLACGCSDRRARELSIETPRSSWPVLLVAEAPTPQAANDALSRAGVVVEAPSAERRRTAAMAVGALSPPALEALEDALEKLRQRLEIRANPLVDNLEDEPPEAALTALARGAGPSLTACDAITSRRSASSDRRFVVSVAMSCPAEPDPSVKCLPLWPSSDVLDDGGRARFFAWSLASAGVVSVKDSGTAKGAAVALRRRADLHDSHTALVLTEADLAGRSSSALGRVRERARRALELARQDSDVDTTLLSLLAQDVPDGRVIPWLRLDDDEVLVIPKLGAMGALPALSAEVEEVLAAQRIPMQWVERPTRRR